MTVVRRVGGPPGAPIATAGPGALGFLPYRYASSEGETGNVPVGRSGKSFAATMRCSLYTVTPISDVQLTDPSTATLAFLFHVPSLLIQGPS